MRAKRSAAILGIAALGLSGCGFKGLYGAPLPGGADLGDHPYTVTAYFDDALDLVPQSAVKVNDVAVGKVTGISLDGWSAKVKVEVRGSVKLPANSTAEIAQTSLLGEKYVSLDAPTTAPMSTNLHNHSIVGCPGVTTVPKNKVPSCALSHTRSAAEVEQVLGALSLLLNEGGVRQIKVIGDELNKALKGHEPAIRDLVKQLNSFVGTLDDQKDKITTALDDIDTLAKTLNRQKQILLDALDTFPQALKVLSQERGKLVTLLSSLSHLGSVATNVIDATQQDLVTALRSLNPALTQLKGAAGDIPGALRIMGTFPFPLGTTRQFVRGDYANLDAYLDLNLNGTLCQLPGLGVLCKGTHTSPSSAKQQPLKPGIVGGSR